MNNNEILLDTNVIRRLLEDNASMIKIMHSMQNDGYNFSISDMSLFELLDANDVQLQLNKFLGILYDYKIVPIYKDVIKDFDKDFFNWFKQPISVLEMKNQLFPSFSFTLSTFLSDFTNAIIVFIANKYCQDYLSEFYQYIRQIVNQNDSIEHFNRVLENCYIFNKEKIRKRLPNEFKDLIIRLTTYYNLLRDKSTFNEEEFEREYETQQLKYSSFSFKEICSSLLSEDDIVIKFDNNMNDIDINFIICYFKQILTQNATFSINDITDYINFKYAMKYCSSYYTTDTTSLKKYTAYFKNSNAIEFLEKIESTLNRYAFVAN